MIDVSKIRKSVWAVLFTLMLALALVPSEALATTTRTVKNLPGSTTNATAMQKATRIKKGAQILKFQKGSGLGVMKFTAPTTKTYAFTFTNVNSPSKYTAGSVQFYTMTASSHNRLTIKLSEGKRTIAPLCSASLADGSKYTSGNATFKRLKTRTVKLRINKGKTVYLLSMFMNQNQNPVAAKCKLVIK